MNEAGDSHVWVELDGRTYHVLPGSRVYMVITPKKKRPWHLRWVPKNTPRWRQVMNRAKHEKTVPPR